MPDPHDPMATPRPSGRVEPIGPVPTPSDEPLTIVTTPNSFRSDEVPITARSDSDSESTMTMPDAKETPKEELTKKAEQKTGPQLRVVRGEKIDMIFRILPGKNYLGRTSPDKPVDIDLTNQERVEQVWASRQHAVITLDRGAVLLEDLNSLNGTYVNRVRLYPGQSKVLQPGDVLQIGTVQLRLECD